MTQGAISVPCALASDERLRVPLPERGIHDQPVAPLRRSTLAGQVGFDRGFVNKNKVIRASRYGWRPALEPVLTLFPYLYAVSLGRDQRPFCT
jgi:hypothetical protein